MESFRDGGRKRKKLLMEIKRPARRRQMVEETVRSRWGPSERRRTSSTLLVRHMGAYGSKHDVPSAASGTTLACNGRRIVSDKLTNLLPVYLGFCHSGEVQFQQRGWTQFQLCSSLQPFDRYCTSDESNLSKEKSIKETNWFPTQLERWNNIF